MPAVDWTTWLAEFNQELLARLDLKQPNAFRDPRVTTELLEGGWLGAPGADEASIETVESRLDTRLPPSYRSFLGVTNGFLQPDLIVPRLRRVSELAWFGEEDPETVAIWAELAGAGDPLSSLGGCLQVSDVELVGTAVYLLDPSRRSPGGEWEAYFFAHWVPGIDRYASFFELMQAQREMYLQQDQPA